MMVRRAKVVPLQKDIARRLEDLLRDYKHAHDDGLRAEAQRAWSEYERIRVAALVLAGGNSRDGTQAFERRNPPAVVNMSPLA
jgi:hypothetical protein